MSRFPQVTAILTRLQTARDEARAVQTAITDIARYATTRFSIRKLVVTRADDHLINALNGIVLDAMNGLIEAKKETAVCIADLKLAHKLVETEKANAAECLRNAERARVAGDDRLMREAQERAAAHERSAVDAQARAELLHNDVERLKVELRRVNTTIERAKAAKNKLFTDRAMRQARSTVQREVASAREVLAILEAIAAVTDSPEGDR